MHTLPPSVMRPEGSIPKQIAVAHFCWNLKEALASQVSVWRCQTCDTFHTAYGAQVSAPVTPTVETESRSSISNEDSSVLA